MFLGRLLAVFAAFASGTTSIFAPLLKEAGWSSWQIAGARSVVGFLILVLYVRGDLRKARADLWGCTQLALISLVGMSSYIFALTHASMGTSVCMLYLSTAWVTIFQRFRGAPERYDLASTALVIAGVLFATGHGDRDDTLIGVLAAGLGGVMQACYTVVSSRVTQKVPPPVVACLNMSGGTLVLGGFIFLVPMPVLAVSWPYALSLGVMGGAGFFLASTLAFQKIGVETRMWLPFDLVFVWMAQSFIRGEVPSTLSGVGVAFIVSAAILLAYGKRQPRVAPAT